MSRKRDTFEEVEEVEVAEEVDADDDDGEEEDAKRPRKSLLKENPQGEKYGDLGRGKRVTVRAFKGKVGVDIREFYEDNSGKMMPGKKGIWLTKENFMSLLQYLPEVEDMVAASH